MSGNLKWTKNEDCVPMEHSIAGKFANLNENPPTTHLSNKLNHNTLEILEVLPMTLIQKLAA